jgi:peptidase M1-like protein
MKKLRSFFLLASSLLLLSACRQVSEGGLATDPRPSASPPVATALPTSIVESPVETPTAAAPTPVPPERAQYTLDATLNYVSKGVTVNESIVYPNRTGAALNDMVLAVEPNLWSGGFVLQSVAVDGAPPASFSIEPQSQKLTIALAAPVPDGAGVNLSLAFTLILPRSATYADPNDVRPQIYGYTDRQVNLVDWYPFVVPYVPGSGWLLHNPWFYGEHLVYDPADFDVTLRFADPTVVPVIASSGEQISATEDGFRYRLENGRTFAFSMSSQFEVESTTVDDVTVYSYYFPFYKNAGHAVLQTTAKALEIYSDKFGPYLHKTLSAVQGDFNDGMEFAGLYFLSRDFYNFYDGTPKNYLTIIAAHETAHQWWFDAVANDQALEPWLDESLATYSEHIFFENAFPGDVQWWWDFRVNFYAPTGFVDTAIYDAGGYRPYLNAVYLSGAKFHDDVRTRIGDADFFAFVQDLYQRKAGGRVTADEYFSILGEHTSANISDIIGEYFQTAH